VTDRDEGQRRGAERGDLGHGANGDRRVLHDPARRAEEAPDDGRGERGADPERDVRGRRAAARRAPPRERAEHADLEREA
jgi:hypothetical protein